MYAQLKAEGADLPQYLAAQKLTGHDNGRTPLQWDATTNAGFTTGTPWLKINPNYPQVNATVEEKDPTSVLNYFRQATAARRQHKVLVYDQYQLLDKDNPDVYAYTRTLGPERVLVVLNFTSEKRAWTVSSGLKMNGQPWLNNYPTFTPAATLALQPWQAVVVPLR